MKKILFVTPTLQYGGGVIRSLQNFLLNVSKSDCIVDILPTGFTSEEKVILPNCNILEDNFLLTCITSVYSQTIGYKYRKFLWIGKILLNILSYLRLRKFVEHKIFLLCSKKYRNYDTIVAFQEGLVTQFVSLIPAPYKIAWIHCDYAEYHKLYKVDESLIYSSFNKIYSVSKYTKSQFDSIYPNLSYKSDFIYNYLDISYIKSQSNESITEMKPNSDIFYLVSLGRIHEVKQFSLIPEIIKGLQDRGVVNFKWFLLGTMDDKIEFNNLLAKLQQYNISKDSFEYIGSRSNPYPYIKRADILVSLSKSEACPFVVNEAKVLHVPVLSNNYPSIYEFINNGTNGFICPIKSMTDKLFELLSKEEVLKSLKSNAQNCSFSNDSSINKFALIFDN